MGYQNLISFHRTRTHKYKQATLHYYILLNDVQQGARPLGQ
jgi:hypothetical protein